MSYEQDEEWCQAHPEQVAREREVYLREQRKRLEQWTRELAEKAAALDAAERRGRRGKVAMLRPEVAELEVLVALTKDQLGEVLLSDAELDRILGPFD